jgi:hypothetical protein
VAEVIALREVFASDLDDCSHAMFSLKEPLAYLLEKHRLTGKHIADK